MKRKHSNGIKALILLLMSVFITNSCSDLMNNPLQDKDTGEDLTLLLLDLNFFNTKVAFHFVDDSTGLALAQDLTVTLSGKDVDKIVSFDGLKLTEYHVKNGILELAVDPNYTPTEESPIEFEIAANNADYSYSTPPVTITFTDAGIHDELIGLTYFDPQEEEEGGSEELDLKSASATNVTTPFIFRIYSSPKHFFTYREYNKRNGIIQYYYRYRYAGSNLNGLAFEAKNASASSNLIRYGITGSYYDMGPSGTVLPLNIYYNVKNYLVYTSSIGKYTACGGITVKFDIDGDNASAKFNYVLTYADGSTKKGILALAERKDQGGNPLGYQSIITGIAYPTEKGGKATLVITGDSQYNLEYNKDLSDVCGATVNVKVTPKINTYNYDMTVVINCEAGPVGAAPSLLADISKVGSDEVTQVNFTGGTATLRLEKNTDYNLSGSYNGKSRSFGFSTNKATAQSFGDAIAASEKELKAVTINVTDPTSTRNGQIDVVVTFNKDDCPL